MSLIFDIKHYSINDGPGIRTTIFFKGCALRCVWCHNPEGIAVRTSRMYNKSKCIGCASCVEVCSAEVLTLSSEGVVVVDSGCVSCGRCADVCPSKAMEFSGKEYSVDQLMAEIEKDRIFYDKSGGGVTFCGGEPLSSYEVVVSLLDRCKSRDIHTVVDTSLYAKEGVVLEVAKRCDMFLVDLKIFDSDLHKRYCGVGNEQILSNIKLLAECGYNFVVRIPLIDGVNCDSENIVATARFLADIPWKDKVVNLLPYHDIAKHKHAKLGSVYYESGMKTPSDELVFKVTDIFSMHGISVC